MCLDVFCDVTNAQCWFQELSKGVQPIAKSVGLGLVGLVEHLDSQKRVVECIDHDDPKNVWILRVFATFMG